MMTDTVADLLTRIRNAMRARRVHVEVPWSRLKEGIVRVLASEGFVGEWAVVGEGHRRELRIELRYDQYGRPVIVGLRRVSKPSRRVYVGGESIPQVRRGLGVSVLSTPAGVLVDREARRRHVGGEVLCAVW